MAETANAYPITEAYVMQFTGNVKAALNRKGGILSAAVSRGMYMGEKSQVVNFLGPVQFTKRDTAYADTVATEPAHTQRWISADDYDLAILIDRIDTLRMLYDPTNPYVERVREAWARQEDDIINTAFFASAKTGKNGASTTAFPTATDVIAANASTLTFVKLRALRRGMKKRHVDLRAERPVIAVSADEIDGLLAETVVGSHDYNAVKPLVDGEVSQFMGFSFLPLEGTLSEVSGVRQCPAWVPSGMHYGDWQNFTVIVNTRADKNNIPQIHASFSGGATRLEEGKVWRVDCTIPA